MDTQIAVGVIVAVVAVIPGIWALIATAKKDNDAKMDMYAYDTKYVFDIVQTEVSKLKYRMGDMEENLFDKMYNKRVIIHCKYCNSANAISNIECIKCGAPLN